MPAGFAVCWEGLDDLIRVLEAVEFDESYQLAATDTAERAAGEMAQRAQDAGVPQEVIDRITPYTDSRGVVGVKSGHPLHARYEYGDLTTQPVGFWRSTFANRDYDQEFQENLAARMGLWA